jgi:hypothetical protein
VRRVVGLAGGVGLEEAAGAGVGGQQRLDALT